MISVREQSGLMPELGESIGDVGGDRGQEPQVAVTVSAEGRMQARGHLEALRGIGFNVGDLVDVLPERHREPFPPNRFTRNQRARPDYRMATVGKPAGHRDLRALLCGLPLRTAAVRARQHGRDTDHHGRRRQVDDDGEHVIEHPGIVHAQPQIVAGGACGAHRAGRSSGDLVGGEHQRQYRRPPVARREVFALPPVAGTSFSRHG